MRHVYIILGVLFFLNTGLLFADGGKKTGENLQLNTHTVRPLTNSLEDNLNPYITTNGNRRAITVWDQSSIATGFDVFGQMMAENAAIVWADVGRIVSGASENQQRPVAISDGSGGAIVAFADDRGTSWRVNVMRINHRGDQLWGGKGLEISDRPFSGPNASIGIVSDEEGGAIITWESPNSSTNYDINAQRISSAGDILWGNQGRWVTSAHADERNPIIISDGLGGAVVCWEDSRNETTDIYANRLDPNGQVEWTFADTAVSPAGGTIPQLRPSMTLDASGAIVFSWTQRISAMEWNIEWSGRALDGTKIWGVLTAHGQAFDDNSQLLRASDGTILVWEANASGGDKGIYAQKVSLDGQSVLWGLPSVAVNDTSLDNSFANPQIVTDGNDGAIVSYEREFSATDRDVWVQHLNSAGVHQWTSGSRGGLVISEGRHDETKPVLASDGVGGAYFAWEDNRSGNWDIYGDRVDATGTLVGIEDETISALPTSYVLEQNYPNPFNPTTEIQFATPRSGEVMLTVHNMLGQTVRTLVSGTVEAGNHTVSWNGKNDRGEGVTSGIYLYRMTVGSEVSAKKMMLIR